MTVLCDAQIYAGSVDLTGQANQVAETWSAQIGDKTTFASECWTEHFVGNRSATLDVQTYLNEALDAGQLEAGVQPLVCSVAETDADLGHAYSLVGAVAEAGQEWAMGELVRQPLTIRNSGEAFAGYLLMPKSTQTTAGDGSDIELGAITAGMSLRASLHIFSVTGGNLRVYIESDDADTFGSGTDRIDFGAQTVAGGHYRKFSTVTADSHWRVRWTQTASSATFAVVAGIH